jgi:hypothetical protein
LIVGPSDDHPPRGVLPSWKWIDPVLGPAALVRPVAPLRHQTLQIHPAGGAKHIAADLATLARE